MPSAGVLQLEFTENSAALSKEKSKADKKYIKRMSKSFSIPLLLEQVFGVFILIAVCITMMFIRTVVFHQPSFSLKTFAEFLGQSNNSDWLTNFFSLFSYFACMFVVFVLIAALLKQNPFKTIPMKITHPELILPLIAIGMLVSIIGDLYANYFQSILQVFNLQVVLDQFSFPDNVPALIVYFFTLSIFAPFCEEFIFRGLIMQNLRKFGDFFAVLISSLLFAILHGNLQQTPFAFVVGFALGFAVIETGSIFVGILLHFSINTVSLIFTGISFYAGDKISNITYFIYIAVIVVLSVISVISLKKKNFFKGISKRYFDYTVSVPQAVGVFVKTPAFIVFLVFYCLSMLLTVKPI